MARDGPDTATSDFFICVGDQPALDYGGKRNPDGQGFAAFGRVVLGMDVVRKIQAAPAKGQALEPPVRIDEHRAQAGLHGGYATRRPLEDALPHPQPPWRDAAGVDLEPALRPAAPAAPCRSA